MLKKHMAACLVATATLISVPAFAQTNPPAANTPTPAPSSTMPSATGSTQFMTQMTQDEWRASKLVGLNIYGANNEKIGDVNEVILDRTGNAKAVVVGVGGFLGIGEKNVAIPFQNVEWTYASRSSVAANTSGSAVNNPPATASGNVATSSNSTVATSTAPRTDVTGTTVATTRNMDYPDHGIVRMTKADLQNAPAFHYASDTRAAPAPAGYDGSRRNDCSEALNKATPESGKGPLRVPFSFNHRGLQAIPDASPHRGQ